MREKLHKIFAGLLAVCLLVSLGYAPIEVKAIGSTYTIGLQGNPNYSDSWFNYEGGKVKVTINGAEASTEEIGDIGITDTVVVTLNADEGNVGNLVYGGMSDPGNEPSWVVNESGSTKTYTFTASDVHITGESGSNYLALNCEFKNSDDPGPGPTPTEGITFRIEGDSPDKATIQYSTDNGLTWNTINTNTTLDSNIETAKVKVTYNSSDIMVQSPGWGDNGVIESGKEYVVSEKLEYSIQIDKIVRTVVWAYDDAFGPDGKVEHGTVEIISAIKPGETEQWSGIEPEIFPGVNNIQDEVGGRVAIIPGSTVTVKIIPDYGYQFMSGSLNGNEVIAGNEVGTFTFVMPNTNLHLSALFTKNPDKVDVSADGITSATIDGGAGVISSGNLKLKVMDSTMKDSEKTEMMSSEACSGVTITNWLKVDLEQIINKGNSLDMWTTELEELSQKVTIALNVGTKLDATKSYVVIRKHKGVYEQIPATYDKAKGTLTFKSDKFSDYAIGTMNNYPVIEGANGSFVMGSGEYTIRIDGDFAKFVDLYIDGKLVDKKYYTAKSGSTIITFTSEYMKTLSLGTHNIKVKYTDGYAETTMTILGETSKTNETSEAKTSDNTPITMLLIVAIISGAGVILTSKKRAK
ncbi:MAG: hypothetical protein GX275_13975 [Clostridiales bacterium]|nr:hypothetical protein [Clostridiales bacterium]